jgi:hypothetical protein
VDKADAQRLLLSDMVKPSKSLVTPDCVRITRSLSRSLSAAASADHPQQQQRPTTSTSLRGILRCKCDRYLLSPHDQLIECIRCFNWCHLLCAAIDPQTLHLAKKEFVCDFCKQEEAATKAAAAPGIGAKRARSSSACGAAADHATMLQGAAPPTTLATLAARGPSQVQKVAPPPRQIPVKLSEVKDVTPHDDAQLVAIGTSLRSLTDSLGFDLVEYGGRLSAGNGPVAPGFTDAVAEQCMACCSAAIRDATFSDSYPRYCMKEVQQQHHPYLQATVLRCRATQLVVSLVLSNGMDPYGNLKGTIAQLRRAAGRAASSAASPVAAASSSAGSGARLDALLDAAGLRGAAKSEEWAAFAAECFAIADFSDLVHVTLTATHADFRNRGLAKIAMLNELVRWLRRGRSRAFLNMALEKRLAPASSTITCAPPLASRNLYHLFGFQEVFPRVEKATGAFRWTVQEADMGRVMANLNIRASVMPIAEDVARRHRSHLGIDAHVEGSAAVGSPKQPSMRLRRKPS